MTEQQTESVMTETAAETEPAASETGPAPAADSPAAPPKRPKKPLIKRIFGNKWVKAAIILLVIGGMGFGGLQYYLAQQKSSEAKEVKTAKVTRQTIQSALSSSGTLAPLNSYNITSLVSGEVIAADFEEGDQVKKGDVLYKIDTDSVDKKITSANTALERAQKNYEKAQQNYAEAAEKYKSLNYASTLSGYVTTVYVEAGDTITNGTKLVDIYDDSTMLLKVAFPSAQIDKIAVGDTAQLTVSQTYETLTGKVTAVSSLNQALTGGVLTRTVTIEVNNPGGLTTNNTATAVINDVKCSADGTFTAKLEKTITADRSGKVDKVNVTEGGYIASGATLFSLTSQSVKDSLDSVQTSLDNAKQSLEDAKTSLENQQDTLSDYDITAPIAGQVIVKTTKVGDTLNNSNNSTTMAVIYDLSALTFEMSVDEMDVLSVKVGQEVEVVADALEDKTFTGKVTNVSLQSSTSNGVTNYPVTVEVDDFGDMLPGMNVSAKIILDESENTLAIPAEALMRGNTVYVKDDSVKESSGKVPAGFRSVEVKTGLTSTDYVEITSGLSEGDEVYIETSSSSTSTTANMMMGMGGGMGGPPSGGGNGGPPSGGGGGNNGGGSK